MDSGTQIIDILTHAVEERIKGKVDEQRVCEIVQREIAQSGTQKIEVTTEHTNVKVDGIVHGQLKELLALVSEGCVNICMVGPSGSGKSMLAKSFAKALDLPYGFLSHGLGINEPHMFGRRVLNKSGEFVYEPSPFVKMYTKAGVWFDDELDSGDPNLGVTRNAAMDSGRMFSNPVDGNIYERGAKHYMVGAMNTWGAGADAVYAGRIQQDAATLDRYCLATVYVDYDKKLEKKLVAAYDLNGEGDELLAWVWKTRESITKNRLRRVCSTRLVERGAAAIKAGRKLEDIKARYFLGWSNDEKAKIAGGGK